MNIHRKWIELLNEIAEAPTEELQSCPSELLRGVQHKLCAISTPDDGQENIAALGAYKQAACTCNKGAAPGCTWRSGLNSSTATESTDTKQRLLQTVLQKSKAISKFLKLDLEKTFQQGVQVQGVDPRIQDIAKLGEKTKFDKIRWVFGCWTLFLDNREWIRSKTPHESSVKKFTESLGSTATGVVTYGLKNGAKVDLYIKAFKGVAIMPLLPFIPWRRLDHREVSAFAKLCYDDKTIKEFLETGAQVYSASENIFRMSIQKRNLSVQQLVPAKRISQDVCENRHRKSQKASTASAALQSYSSPSDFSSGSNGNLNMCASTSIYARNVETSTLSQHDEYLSNPSAPIDGYLNSYPGHIDSSLNPYPGLIDGSLNPYPGLIDGSLNPYSGPIDSSLNSYPGPIDGSQLETPEQSLGHVDGSRALYLIAQSRGIDTSPILYPSGAFNDSLSSMVHAQNIPINNPA